MTKTEEFIKKAKKIHNSKYVYNTTVYTNQKTKVEIFCKRCSGYFKQAPRHHLAGRGCRVCSDIERGKKRRLTTEEFVKKAIEIHKEKYIYDKVVYTSFKNKVKIFCKKCNLYFEQIAGSHLNGSGCKKCGDKKTFTTEKFVERSKRVHGDKYGYKEVDYTGIRDKVKIFCHSCEEYYQQKPLYHLQGRGCYKCVRRQQRLTIEEFIKKAKKIHGDKFKYNKTDYVTAKTFVEIFCKKCNKLFMQTPICHLNGNGCKVCGGSERLTTEEFKERSKKVHNNKYNYDKVIYINAHTKVEIYCKKCEKYFKQSPASHLMIGSGCSICRYKNEKEVGELLKKYFKPLGYIIYRQKNIYDYIGTDCKKHRRNCDFWMEKDNIKIMVEYDGEGHFKSIRFGGMSVKKADEQFRKRRIIDGLDKIYCDYNNIKLKRINYTEEKEDLILQLRNTILDRSI